MKKLLIGIMASTFFMSSLAFANVEVVCASTAGGANSDVTISTPDTINNRIQDLEKAGKIVKITQLTSSASISATSNSEGQISNICAALSY